MIKKAFKKMTQQQRELAALRSLHMAKRGLGVQRERFRLRHHEEPLEFLTNSHCASPLLSAPQCPVCPAAVRVAQKRFPDSAGSSSSQDRRGARRPKFFPSQSR